MGNEQYTGRSPEEAVKEMREMSSDSLRIGMPRDIWIESINSTFRLNAVDVFYYYKSKDNDGLFEVWAKMSSGADAFLASFDSEDKAIALKHQLAVALSALNPGSEDFVESLGVLLCDD